MTAWRRGVVVCLTLIVSTGVTSRGQQTPARDAAASAQPVGTSTIAGVVVADDASARPLRLATVTLVTSDGASGAARWFTATGMDGRFSFASLPAGRYTITVSKPPYVTTYYGSRRPGIGPATPVVVAANETLPVTVKLIRGAAIEGHVFGYTSSLGPAGIVQVMQWRMSGGERTLSRFAGSAQADADGLYRIFGLPPGEYLIMFSSRLSPGGGAELRRVTPQEIQWAERLFQTSAAGGGSMAGDIRPPDPGPAVAMAPVYYPGTVDPAAAVAITLGPGEERTGVDLSPLFVPTSNIAGVILDPDGQPPVTMQANLIGLGDAGTAGPSVFLRPTPDGRFSARGLLPGAYVLVVRAAERPAPGAKGQPAGGRGGQTRPSLSLWASEELTLDGNDRTDLTIRLQPGMTISGRVSFEASTLPVPADLSGVSISLAPSVRTGVTVGVPPVTANPDGTFEFTGVTPGEYRLGATMSGMPPATTAGSGAGWMPKSATVGGHDSLDTPFTVGPGANIEGAVITMTDRISELSGTLVDSGGRPAPDYFILVFSTNRRMWAQNSRRTRQARPAANGNYRIPALPPGEYYLCALTDLDPNQLNDDAFLEQLIAASIRVTIAEGEKKVQSLKIGGF